MKENLKLRVDMELSQGELCVRCVHATRLDKFGVEGRHGIMSGSGQVMCLWWTSN